MKRNRFDSIGRDSHRKESFVRKTAWACILFWWRTNKWFGSFWIFAFETSKISFPTCKDKLKENCNLFKYQRETDLPSDHRTNLVLLSRISSPASFFVLRQRMLFSIWTTKIYWKQWKWFGTNSKFETSFTFFIVFITNFFVEIFGIKRSKEIPNRLNEIHRWIYFGSIVIKFGNLTRWRSRPRSHRTCGASTAMGSSSCSSSNSSSSPCWKDYIEYLIVEIEQDILDYHSNHDLLV